MKYATLKILLCIFTLCLISCEKDTNDHNYSNSSSHNSSTVSAPTFDTYLTTTDKDGFDIRIRFKNGGDKYDNMKCTVYWKRYSSKPSTTPLKSDMTNVEEMRIYDHNQRSTTFDKAHAGYSGGSYIYYYAICTNSAGHCSTNLTYCIVKR